MSLLQTIKGDEPRIKNDIRIFNSIDLEIAFSGKRVIFITTKNVDYIRNVQEIKLLQQYASLVKIISSKRKKYYTRMLDIYMQIACTSFKEFDCVFVGFAPQLICPIWTWKFHGQLVIDFFVSVYDTMVNDRKRFKKHSVAASISHWVDSFTLKKADYIITDTLADACYFIKEFNGIASKFMTMYLEADESLYYPRQSERNSSLKNQYVVLYFGSILPLQGIDVVLEAASLLKDNKDIHMQIIGPIPESYSKPIQSNVEYIDWLSQEELAEYIAKADLCLAGHFNARIDKAKRTIPGKAYIYNAMEKNMILGDNAANREIFIENSHVRYVPMGDPVALRNAIIEYYNQQKGIEKK